MTPYRVSSTDSRAWIRDILYPVLEAYFLASKTCLFSLFMFALSSTEASLCRREAGEREKRKRVGDDGNPAGASALAEQRVMFAVLWPPSLSYHWRRLGRVEISTLAVEVRGERIPTPLWLAPTPLHSTIQHSGCVCTRVNANPKNLKTPATQTSLFAMPASLWLASTPLLFLEFNMVVTCTHV